MIIEILGSALLLIGGVLMLISAIGMVRLPDFYIRNSASVKAVVLGLLLILLGVGLYYNELVVFLETMAIMFFIFVISPLAAHIISRAAVITKVRFWDHTNLKELESYRTRREEKDDGGEGAAQNQKKH